MKKRLFALLAISCLSLAGCSNANLQDDSDEGPTTNLDESFPTEIPSNLEENALDKDLPYPDSGYADGNSDSWKQLDANAETVEINWYMDSSTFAVSQDIIDQVERECKVKIKMSFPVTDDGTKLATLIAGDMLPDVITITDASTREQLQEDGYVYAINRLANKYAPSLINRIDLSEYNYYRASDGNLYTLANNFYTDSAVDAYTQMGKTLLTNGCFNVRKDYLFAYLEQKYNVSRNDPDFYTKPYTEVTRPDGFIEMCKWVKKNYGIANNIPMAVIDSNSIKRLAEYFCVPIEDAQGNYIYDYAQPQMKEAYMFLNELYRENILTSGALSASNASIGQNIVNGNVFFSMLTSQNYINYFKLAWQDGIEYVPIVITNSQGDAPILRNLAGYGFRCSMITKNAKHVDRIIKAFDFLMSSESMVELYYGKEGETFEYDIRPGETVDGITYKYGLIHYTPTVAAAIAADNFGLYKIRKQSFFFDPMFARLSTQTPEAAIALNDYILYDMKAAVNPYTMNKSSMDFTYDTTSKKYNRMINLKSTLSNLWTDNMAEIITQSSLAKASQAFDGILSSAEDYGLDGFVEYQNQSYQKYKNRLGLSGCLWLKNQSTYTAPEVRLMGYVDENIEIPNHFKN